MVRGVCVGIKQGVLYRTREKLGGGGGIQGILGTHSIMYFYILSSFFSESNIILHHNEILDIPAALIYSAQLTDGLAFYLGVNLPHHIEYMYVHLNCSLLYTLNPKLE